MSKATNYGALLDAQQTRALKQAAKEKLDRRIQSMRIEGLTWAVIAERTGKDLSYVYRVLRKDDRP